MKNLVTIFIGVMTSVLIGATFMDVSGEVEEVNDTYGNLIAFQLGAYKDEESAKFIAEENDAIVVQEENYYVVYNAILSNSSNIDRMMNILDNSQVFYYAKVISASDLYIGELYKYEELMKNCTSDIAFLKLVNQILKKYEVTYEY